VNANNFGGCESFTALVGSIYRGNKTHPLIDKFIKAVLDGIENRIHTVHEPIGTEMFNPKCSNMT
jgi:hypothetical protein